MILDFAVRNDPLPYSGHEKEMIHGKGPLHEHINAGENNPVSGHDEALKDKDSFAAMLDEKKGDTGNQEKKVNRQDSGEKAFSPGTKTEKEKLLKETDNKQSGKNSNSIISASAPDKNKKAAEGQSGEKSRVRPELDQGQPFGSVETKNIQAVESDGSGAKAESARVVDAAFKGQAEKNEKKGTGEAGANGAGKNRKTAENLLINIFGIAPEKISDMASARSNAVKNILNSGTARGEPGKAEPEKKRKEVFRVIDLRDAAGKKISLSDSFANSLKTDSPDRGLEIKSIEQGDRGVKSVGSFELKETAPQPPLSQIAHIYSANPQSAAESRGGFSLFHNQVLENLRESGNLDIIQNAKMVLKDNNSGEIRLLMKPESLGYVRIKLTIEDNNIAGKIIVDNNSVKEIFESNMENLARSFRENGYSSANIDVSVGGEKSGNEKRNSDGSRFVAVKTIESVGEHNVTRNYFSDYRLIDMVV